MWLRNIETLKNDMRASWILKSYSHAFEAGDDENKARLHLCQTQTEMFPALIAVVTLGLDRPDRFCVKYISTIIRSDAIINNPGNIYHIDMITKL